MQPATLAMWSDLVKQPRDERLTAAGFTANTLRSALRTTKRNLKSDNADAQLRAADQVYKLAGVYAPSEHAGRAGHGAQVIVMLPDLRALYLGAEGQVSITPADAALAPQMAESETVIDDAELA